MGRLPLYHPEQLFIGSVLSPQGQRYFLDLQRLLGKLSGTDWEVISKDGATIRDIDSAAADTIDATRIHIDDETIHHTLEEIQDDIAAMLTEGNAVTLTYDDVTNTLTVAVDKVAASADTVVTAAGPAGVVYTAAEQGMIDALIADVTTLTTALNDLKANMRTAGILEP